MNEGYWPFDEPAVEDAYNEHSSYPANPLIDNGLFFAGTMDTWGQGFMLIKDECQKTEAPLPEINETEKYVTVTIRGCKKYMELLKNSTGSNLGTGEGASEGASEVADKIEKLLQFCSEPKSKVEIQEFMGIKRSFLNI